MKVLSRDFTKREKISLLILSIILVSLCYYKFVDQPIREALLQAENQKIALNLQLEAIEQKIYSLKLMEEEIASMESSQNMSVMPSYNNEKQERNLLNNLLRNAIEYNITFTDVTREGDQIRRNFTLHYVADNINVADAILQGLYQSGDRCMLGDISYKAVDDQLGTDDITQGKVSVDVTATFYETMVGGTPDSGLPEDSLSEQNSEE